MPGVVGKSRGSKIEKVSWVVAKRATKISEGRKSYSYSNLV